jgi:hypothetical protein
MNLHKPDGYGSLVSEIAAQTQNPYRLHDREFALKIIAVASMRGAIVHQKDIDRALIWRNGLVKTPDQFRGRRPVIPDRHEHCQAQSWILCHGISIINFLAFGFKGIRADNLLNRMESEIRHP